MENALCRSPFRSGFCWSRRRRTIPIRRRRRRPFALPACRADRNPDDITVCGRRNGGDGYRLPPPTGRVRSGRDGRQRLARAAPDARLSARLEPSPAPPSGRADGPVRVNDWRPPTSNGQAATTAIGHARHCTWDDQPAAADRIPGTFSDPIGAKRSPAAVTTGLAQASSSGRRIARHADRRRAARGRGGKTDAAGHRRDVRRGGEAWRHAGRLRPCAVANPQAAAVSGLGGREVDAAIAIAVHPRCGDQMPALSTRRSRGCDVAARRPDAAGDDRLRGLGSRAPPAAGCADAAVPTRPAPGEGFSFLSSACEPGAKIGPARGGGQSRGGVSP